MAEPILVIYHAGCWDGYCAAWLFRKAFPDCERIAIQYGQDRPYVGDRDVVVVDFSWPRDVLLEMNKEANSLVVLDHHKSAEAELNGLYFCTFADDKSGARLAWEYLSSSIAPSWCSFIDNYASTGVPWLVNYIEDRDLWRFALPNSREINAALRTYPLKDEVWDEIYNRGLTEWRTLIAEGTAIRRSELQLVEQHVRHAVETELDGHTVKIVNATCLVSEIAGELAKDRPFGVVWFETKNGDRIYSLRSTKSGIDVSELAKKFGGGGHKNAAGFTIPAGCALPHTQGQDEAQEVTLSISINPDNTTMILDFGDPISRLELDKDLAIEVAKDIQRKATKLE